MGWDITGYRILLGLPHNEGHHVLNAVAARRFSKIKPRFQHMMARDPDWGYTYDGSRTTPRNVADRFVGSLRRTMQKRRKNWGNPWKGLRGKVRLTIQSVLIAFGWYDREIEKTWHERANSEYHYRYVKEWDS